MSRGTQRQCPCGPLQLRAVPPFAFQRVQFRNVHARRVAQGLAIHVSWELNTQPPPNRRAAIARSTSLWTTPVLAWLLGFEDFRLAAFFLLVVFPLPAFRFAFALPRTAPFFRVPFFFFAAMVRLVLLIRLHLSAERLKM